ncbi:hypothetical protein QLZ26_08815 [Cronobacter universalis]|uniref:hypothetical protein n=1 Tax=Cronobacter universalis TaxID=535744 RepID=UPI0024AFE865|nr:hypothetical protein [Cronobacter universalis]MDI7660206.1 hypothetical protein [Cronobacter universalis]
MNNIGAWFPEEILNTVEKEFVEKPIFDSAVPDVDKFIAYTLFELRKLNPEKLGTAIFILHPERPILEEQYVMSSSKLFNSGRIFFNNIVSFVNLTFTRGNYYETDLSDPDKEFELIINKHKMGSLPTILLDKVDDKYSIRIYPEGLNSDKEAIFKLEKEILELEAIHNAVENLYRSSLITPTANESADLKLWSDPAKFYPYKNIEKSIQGRLHSYFSANFGCNFLVLPEITTAGGRLDLLLISKSSEGGRQINHALLELKALRSFSSSGGTNYQNNTQLEWIDKGMRQALEYKNAHNPYHSILCCFDMSNKNKTDDFWFGKTKDFSAEHNIHQWRWRIYNSAENKRKSEIKLS